MEFDLENYINSGVLEGFVSGLLDEEEMRAVQQMASTYPAVQEAIDSISLAVESYILSRPQVQPSPTIKPFLMAVIDYTERLSNGEQPANPPIITKQSTAADYQQWLNRSDLQLPEKPDPVHARIIGYTPAVTTAIVWIKEMAPGEVHTDEYEKFLIVDGTCDFTVGDQTRQLVPGDVLFIPLHTAHHFKVTSSIACKVILQRVAA